MTGNWNSRHHNRVATFLLKWSIYKRVFSWKHWIVECILGKTWLSTDSSFFFYQKSALRRHFREPTIFRTNFTIWTTFRFIMNHPFTLQFEHWHQINPYSNLNILLNFNPPTQPKWMLVKWKPCSILFQNFAWVLIILAPTSLIVLCTCMQWSEWCGSFTDIS